MPTVPPFVTGDPDCQQLDLPRFGVQNNSLQFWTAFVQEYFAPGAHIRVTLTGSGPTNSEAQGCEARSLGQKLSARGAYTSSCDKHAIPMHFDFVVLDLAGCLM